jgi:hypothetical protein
MSESDARCLGVPHDKLRALASQRSRGISTATTARESDLFTAFAE